MLLILPFSDMLHGLLHTQLNLLNELKTVNKSTKKNIIPCMAYECFESRDLLS